MSRVFAAGSFIGVLWISTATLRADPAQEPLRVGDRFPALKGQFLTGRDAALPQVSSGQLALVAIGFTCKSRVPVEAWEGVVRWLHHGGFETSRADELKTLLASFVRPVDRSCRSSRSRGDRHRYS